MARRWKFQGVNAEVALCAAKALVGTVAVVASAEAVVFVSNISVILLVTKIASNRYVAVIKGAGMVKEGTIFYRYSNKRCCRYYHSLCRH